MVTAACSMDDAHRTRGPKQVAASRAMAAVRACLVERGLGGLRGADSIERAGVHTCAFQYVVAMEDGEWCGGRKRIIGRRSSTRNVHRSTAAFTAGGGSHRRCGRPPNNGGAVRTLADASATEGAFLVLEPHSCVRTGSLKGGGGRVAAAVPAGGGRLPPQTCDGRRSGGGGGAGGSGGGAGKDDRWRHPAGPSTVIHLRRR